MKSSKSASDSQSRIVIFAVILMVMIGVVVYQTTEILNAVSRISH